MHLMSVSSDLHRHLAAWRSLKGITQEKAAEILGVNKSTINRWENGKRALDLGDLERLAKLYGVDAVALLMAPGEAQMVEGLTRAKAILNSVAGPVGQRWLANGEDLVGAKLPSRQNAA